MYYYIVHVFRVWNGVENDSGFEGLKVAGFRKEGFKERIPVIRRKSFHLENFCNVSMISKFE